MNVLARHIGFGLVAAVLAGCASYEPQTPAMSGAPDLPERFTASTLAPSDAVLDDHPWWRDFGDERLAIWIDRALAHNHDLGASAARLLAAHATVGIAGAARRPIMDFEAGGTRSRQVFPGLPIPGGAGTPSSISNQLSVGFAARWELDLWGRLAALEDAARQEWLADQARHDGLRLALVGLVARTWFAAEAAQRDAAILERVIASYERTEQLVAERVRVGLRPALELELTGADRAAAEAELAAARRSLDTLRRQLESLAGGYPAALVEVPLAGDRDLPVVPVGLPADLLRRRQDLVAIEHRLRAAGARLFASEAQLLPSIALTGSAGLLGADLGDLTRTDSGIWSLGLGLVQPLFSGDRISGEIARDEALREALSRTWSGAFLEALREVETALASEGLVERRREALRVAARRAGAARDASLQRYEAGLGELLTALEAERRALAAERALVAVERARLDLRVDLHLALGGGFGALEPVIVHAD